MLVDILDSFVRTRSLIYVNDYPQVPEYNGYISFDASAIAHGICQEMGYRQLKRLNKKQRDALFVLVHAEVKSYQLRQSKPGKHPGLSYNVTNNCINRLSRCRLRDTPRITTQSDKGAVVVFNLHRHALFTNGKVISDRIGLR